MKISNRRTLIGLVAGLAAIAVVTSAPLARPDVAIKPGVDPAYHVTFDNGYEGWDMDRANCATLHAEGGNPGAFANISRYCDGVYHLTGWFQFGNYEVPTEQLLQMPSIGAKISVDVDVNFYDFWMWGFWIQAERWREVVIEIRDLDNPYVDPDTGYSWPWSSVWIVTGSLQGRDEGWKTFEAVIPDITSDEMPDGWRGYGGPEDQYYRPQLPPDRTFADVIAGADEIWITSLNLDYFYQLTFVHDLNIDNIRIEPMLPTCNDAMATIFVDNDGVIHGGTFDGQTYAGSLTGTDGDDVIVGTPAADVIEGLGGNDMICGQAGDDQIAGGDGMDLLNGGAGANTCTDGEMVVSCQQ
jgi:hypothetical protein